MNKNVLPMGTALAAMVAATSAQALVIDSFNGSVGVSAFSSTSPIVALQTPQSVQGDESAGDSIIGGERDMRVDFSSGNDFEPVSISTGNPPPRNPGSARRGLTYSSGGASSGTGLVVWDGNDDSDAVDFAGLGGLDLTNNGIDDAFLFDVTDSDRLLPIYLLVYTSATEWSFIQFNPPGINSSLAPPITIDLEFTDFIAGDVSQPVLATGDAIPLLPNSPAMSGADFENVNAIALLIDGSNDTGLDIGFDFLRTRSQVVPAPASILLLAPALLLLRRRSK